MPKSQQSQQSWKLKSRYEARIRFQEPSLELISQATLAGGPVRQPYAWFLAPIAGLKLPSLGSISASSDIVESEWRQMKQCWIRYWTGAGERCRIVQDCNLSLLSILNSFCGRRQKSRELRRTLKRTLNIPLFNYFSMVTGVGGWGAPAGGKGY